MKKNYQFIYVLNALLKNGLRQSRVLFILGFCFINVSFLFATDPNTFTDENDGCATGNCSLREAVEEAASGTTINLGSGTYTVTIDDVINIDDKTLTIQGQSDGSTIIDAGGKSSSTTNIFTILFDDNSNYDVQFINVTFQNSDGGSTKGGAVKTENAGTGTCTTEFIDCIFTGNTTANNGGALWAKANSGTLTLTLTQCNFNASSGSGNSATNPGGGGGYYQTGNNVSSTFTNCTFKNNTSYDNGGGVFKDSDGSITINDCELINNSCSNASGGGTFIKNGGTNTISRTMFDGNSTTGTTKDGGGMRLNAGASTTSITNCTFASNSATGDGGGLHVQNSTGSVTIRNCTFAGGNSSAGAAGGGGIAFDASLADLSKIHLKSNIFADNTSTSGGANMNSEVTGALGTNEQNIVEGDCTGCGGISFFSTADPKLLPQIKNGGYSQTLMPDNDSEAIDKGNCTSGSTLSFDQRGDTRPYDDTGIANSDNGCDIGAAERPENMLKFDGTNDYVDFGDLGAFDGASTMTIECWILLKELQNSDRIVSKRLDGTSIGWEFYLGNGSNGGNNDLRFTVHDGTDATDAYTTADMLAIDQWYHVAVRYQGSAGTNENRVKFYINGTEITSKTVDADFKTSLPNTSLSVTLGARGDQSNYIKAHVDELRFWDNARAGSSISSNCCDEFDDCSNSNLIALYHFDQGIANGNNGGQSGTVIPEVNKLQDCTSNARDGTLMNFSFNGTGSNWIPSDAEANVVLPVDLVDFRAQLIDNKVALNWKTLNEINNEGFEIQHSQDGASWKDIGFVEGEGNSYDDNNYSFIDYNPIKGVNYYRLKQIDFDGRFEYSNVENVKISISKGSFTVFPNPTQTNSFTLQLLDNTAERTEMSMYNYTGRQIRQISLIQDNTEVNTSDLDKGMYIIRVEMDGVESWEKVVIQ